MLALTESAVSAIRNLTDQPAVPEGSGLRIATGAVPPSTDTEQPASRALTLAIQTEPQDGDQVLDAAGARLFLEPDAAQYLDDKALDATIDDSGAVQFSVALPPENAG